jgi:hypothetical protein
VGVVRLQNVVEGSRVSGEVPLEELRLGGQQILKRALRALDLAREHGLLADVHEDEQIGVRQREHRTVEVPEGAVGRRKKALATPP